MSGKGDRVKSKNDTWSENELARHINKGGSGAILNKTSPGVLGSPKAPSKPKATMAALTQRKDSLSRTAKATGIPSSQSKGSAGSIKKEAAALSSSPSLSKKEHKGVAERRERTRDVPRDSGKDAKREQRAASKEQSHDEGRRRQSDASGPRSSKTPQVPTSSSRTGDSKAAATSRSSDRAQRGSRTHGSSSSGSLGSDRDRRRAEDHKQRERDRRKEREREEKKSESRDRKSESKDRHSSSRDRKAESKEREGRSDGKGRHRDSEQKEKGRPHDSTDRGKAGGDVQAKKIMVHEEPPVAHGGRAGEREEKEGKLQPMMVVEDGYSYDEDFESYEEDFEEDEEEDEDSNSGKAVIMKVGGTDWKGKKEEEEMGEEDKGELSELMAALETENKLAREHSDAQLAQRKEAAKPAKAVDSSSTKNSPLLRLPKRGGGDGGEPEVSKSRPSHSARKHVDFASAQRKSQQASAARRAKKRGKELQSLIELDLASYDMLNLSPLTEYEVYVKKFGSDDARQVAVQTGEDNMEADTQTEAVPSSNVWVQWPPEDLRGYGRENGVEGEEGGGMDGGVASSGSQDAMRLVSFLKRAGQVCSVLLEENLVPRGKTRSNSAQSQFPFCSSQVGFENIPSELFGWHVSHAHFSPSQDHLVLTAYSQPSSGVKGFSPRGVVCVWNTRDPSQPNMILSCQSPVTCCCFSPLKSSLAFAGGEDGSLVLWDLREPTSMHRPFNPLTSDPQQQQQQTLLGRAPTFSTAGISQLENHGAPVVSISSVSVTPHTALAPGHTLNHTPSTIAVDDSEGLSGLSFQVASIDRNGILKLWVVVEILNPDPYGSDSDLGLVPGGRVKLVKSATVNIVAPNVKLLGAVRVHCLQFHPLHTNHIYVGTDTGCVLHHTRYGRRAIPSHYLPPTPLNPLGGYCGGVAECIGSLKKEDVCDITSISFSPWQPDHFLIGCSNGSIRLYRTNRACPVHCWLDSTDGVPVGVVKWAEHCPGLFFVLDVSSKLYVWDIIENNSNPSFKQQLKSRVSYCTLSSSSPSPHSTPSLLLAYTDGPIEVHQLKRLENSDLLLQREQKLTQYLSQLI